MSEYRDMLKNQKWLQTTLDREASIQAFVRRFGYQPQQVIEGKIGDTVCFYVGPIREQRQTKPTTTATPTEQSETGQLSLFDAM